MVSISESILDFLSGIHGDRSDITSRERAIYERAFTNAYKDMATHTVAYTDYATAIKGYVGNDTARCNKNKENIRNAIFDSLEPEIRKVLLVKTPSDFADWHKKTCNFIVNDLPTKPTSLLKDNSRKDCPETIGKLLYHKDDAQSVTFTYGQAQKILNMMLKYLFIYYECEGTATYSTVSQYFHVPIDRYVLHAALNTYEYNSVPWSKIATYEVYTNCQKEISDFVRNNTSYTTAFQWEVSEWPFS